jgi:hypothetical protein
MAKAPKVYTRLTRSPVSLFSYKSLWLAADHIMQVDSSGYSESYQRFQFLDIQGFFIRDSARRIYWNLFWGMIALTAGLAFIGGVINGDLGVSPVFLFIATVFLIWNNALGVSCRVYLVTRVQTVALGSLVRKRKARKVLGRLQPLIEAAQSGLIKAASPAAAPAPENSPAPPASAEAIAPARTVAVEPSVTPPSP